MLALFITGVVHLSLNVSAQIFECILPRCLISILKFHIGVAVLLSHLDVALILRMLHTSRQRFSQ